MPEEEPTRATGRPMAADPRFVATTGLQLFAEHGYDNVTMSEVAAAAGIGRSTLVRYFPTKAHIVWDRSEDDAERVRSLLRKAAAGDAIAAICDVMPDALAYGEDEFDLLRIQVQIITASSIDLLTYAQHSTEELILAFLRSRRGDVRDDLRDRIAARCLVDAGWIALQAWAATEQHSPHALLEQAYQYVRAGLQPRAV
ncbi:MULTISPECIES: TetR/AcrR family transcriptional regulator [Arsenicicoccus]|uniref:TetR/AcrR family transcriptional regulator n=1 Tax=Arsenicicoccus TaxID=267408 RepID=UPI00257F2536|nr:MULTISPECIES: TetR/AcrR family transcriptional regulator [Arsenicicoccus]